MEVLKPCPFCSGKAFIHGSSGDGFCVFCAECDCALGEGYNSDTTEDYKFSTKEKAIEAWNTRANDETEAHIIINGHTITHGQSMAIRVAIESFAAELGSEGLGDDNHGKFLTKAYLDRISEIRTYLYSDR